MGFLEDELLPQLYSGDLAFVYPSFYEGFGLPVLEAMSCGRPIITSQNSSLPEVAGDSAIYVDPYSINSIKSALQEITDNTALQEELSTKAIQKKIMKSLTGNYREEHLFTLRQSLIVGWATCCPRGFKTAWATSSPPYTINMFNKI